MLLKNIHIVDDNQDFTGDISIKDDLIARVGVHLPSEENTVDFAGQNVTLLPAFTDLHAHFRDPGFTYKEDLLTGSRAALHGGYTAVNLMPNTQPVCSDMAIVHDVEQRLRDIGLVYGNQTLSMTKDLSGTDYQHLKMLTRGEIPFVTDDGKGVNDDAVMEAIFHICKEKNIVIMSHAEDSRYSQIDMRMAE
ncbi:MAG: amidohydrolase family protein, partial [Bacteroidales bacterium]|nr:amidohydrolase family protein [Bacteroidales bacterium]